MVLTNPLPRDQRWRFDSVKQQLAQQLGHKRPLQVDVDEAWEKNVINMNGRKELRWEPTTSTRQLHIKTSTLKKNKLLWWAPESGSSTHLVRQSRSSGWPRCPEGSWWSSLRSLSGWPLFLLPSASEAAKVRSWHKNKPIHTMFVSKTKFQVIPGWRTRLDSRTWDMAMALLHW